MPGEGVGRAWHVGQKKGAFVWGGLGVRGGSRPRSRPAGRQRHAGNAAEMWGPSSPHVSDQGSPQAPQKLGMGISQGDILDGSTPMVSPQKSW